MEAGQRSSVEVFKSINQYSAPRPAEPVKRPAPQPKPEPKPEPEPQNETTASGWGKSEQTVTQQAQTTDGEATDTDTETEEERKRKDKKIGGFFDKLKNIGAGWFESLDEDEEEI